MTRRPEHNLGAFGVATRRMCCQIVRSQIGFHFDDPANARGALRFVNEVFSQ